jgi:hypothetical protein
MKKFYIFKTVASESPYDRAVFMKPIEYFHLNRQEQLNAWRGEMGMKYWPVCGWIRGTK